MGQHDLAASEKIDRLTRIQSDLSAFAGMAIVGMETSGTAHDETAFADLALHVRKQALAFGTRASI
jgi:hypothetical protein